MNDGRTAHPTALLISTTVLYYLLDWIKDVYLYARFGAGALDPFYGATALFDAAVTLSMLTAIAAVVLPVLARARQEGGEPLVERFGSTVLLIAVCALSAVAVLAVVFAPRILHIYGFRVDANGVLVARLIFVILPFVGIDRLTRVLFEDRRRFGPPVAASLIQRVVFLGVVVALASRRGVVGAGGGALSAAVISAAFLAVAFFTVGGRLRRPLGLGHPLVRGALAPLALLWIAGLLAQAPFVDLIFASYFEKGSLSLLRLAARIYDVPLALFCVSVGTAILPRLCEAGAAGDRRALQLHLATALRRSLYFVLPSMFGLMVLAVPLVRVVYRYGRFGAHDARLVGYCLIAYSLALPAMGIRALFARGLYAVNKHKWFIPVELLTLVLNVALNYLLAIRLGWGILGLALSTSVASFGTLALLWWLVRRFIGSEEMRGLGRALARMAGAAAFMAAICQALWLLSAPEQEPGQWVTAVRLVVTVVFGAALYFAATCVLRLEEYDDCKALFDKFIRRHSRAQ